TSLRFWSVTVACNGAPPGSTWSRAGLSSALSSWGMDIILFLEHSARGFLAQRSAPAASSQQTETAVYEDVDAVTAKEIDRVRGFEPEEDAVGRVLDAIAEAINGQAAGAL